jgi:hypothetical protein
MHQKIQDQIDEAGRSPQPDWLEINQLKRLRLSIKDQMRRVLENNLEVPWERPVASELRQAGRAHASSRDA